MRWVFQLNSFNWIQKKLLKCEFRSTLLIKKKLMRLNLIYVKFCANNFLMRGYFFFKKKNLPHARRCMCCWYTVSLISAALSKCHVTLSKYKVWLCFFPSHSFYWTERKKTDLGIRLSLDCFSLFSLSQFVQL